MGAAVEDPVEETERVGGTPAGPLLACVLEVVQLVDHHDWEQQAHELPARRVEHLVQVDVGQLHLVLDAEAGVGHDEHLPLAPPADPRIQGGHGRLERLDPFGGLKLDQAVHEASLGGPGERAAAALQRPVAVGGHELVEVPVADLGAQHPRGLYGPLQIRQQPLEGTVVRPLQVHRRGVDAAEGCRMFFQSAPGLGVMSMR
ncbi:hypothetical protein OOK13_27920 [Streptomyces sp. NBC_00378]|uniref:hypothetical protein n=1 Tax=Streptomyces sp. NBC_00378 TaxID=2975732 RepID=UPI0022518D76|nr:hypothetical protein [Streptomyces sp. NBC_00378]MCX5112289.1 hypothetical protein [Streptomyces sp. NBC_00378]